MDSNSAYDKIIRLLNERGIHFTIHEHEAIKTVFDAEEKLPFPKERFLKTLVFKFKDSGWLLVALKGLDRIDYRKLAYALNVDRHKLIQPSPEEVEGVLGYEIGGVCPIAVRDDIQVIFDRGATSLGTVYCGSGRNDRTLEIRLHDLLQVTQAQVFPLVREK
jgi:Cys-tRNA(Pro)/Cys-tRNA(Cys) deacylase